MSYMKCYSTQQPYQFKLTHDISMENFGSFNDDDDDDDEEEARLFSQVDAQSRVPFSNNGTPTSAFNEFFSFNENENEMKESLTRRFRNNSLSSSTTSLDSLNQKNASLSSSYVQPSTETPPMTKSMNALSLRIEDVEKISSEFAKVDFDKSISERIEERKRMRRLSSAFNDEKHVRDTEEMDKSLPSYSSSLYNLQNLQHSSLDLDDSTSFGMGSLRRRSRRPRKLPEIPTSARNSASTPAKRPSQLGTMSASTSLAEELHEALISNASPDNDPPLMRNKMAIHGRPTTHRHSINLDELGSPDQVDPEHKIKLDESLHSLAGLCDGSDTTPLNDLGDNTADVICLHGSDYDSPRLGTPTHRASPLINKTIADLRNFDDGLGNFNASITGISRAFLSTNNPYMFDDSSPEEKLRSSKVSSPSTASSRSNNSVRRARRDGAQSDASTRSSSVSSSGFPQSFDPEELDLEPTHRGCHKFIPRHDDEIFIEIGDPIYVENEAEDLWCEGINLRSGKKGSFPAAYATDLDLLEGEIDGTFKFRLKFLGSVEVTYHKGNDVLCQAINKVVNTQKMSLAPTAPPVIFLEINEYGMRMIDRSKKVRKTSSPTSSPRKSSLATRILQLLSKEKEPKTISDHFFSLKNVSFCGYHPKNDKYFGFITKHPLEMRFACHVFLSDKTTRPIAEAVGNAFRKFYQEYMAFVHPTEDIYME